MLPHADRNQTFYLKEFTRKIHAFSRAVHESSTGRTVEAVTQCREGAVLIGIQPGHALAHHHRDLNRLAARAGIACVVAGHRSLGAFGSSARSSPPSCRASWTPHRATDQSGELVVLMMIVAILLFRRSGLRARGKHGKQNGHHLGSPRHASCSICEYEFPKNDQPFKWKGHPAGCPILCISLLTGGPQSPVR